MHEDHESGKMLWQKPGLVALKANVFFKTKPLESDARNRGDIDGPRITRTTSSLPWGAWLMHLALP